MLLPLLRVTPDPRSDCQGSIAVTFRIILDTRELPFAAFAPPDNSGITRGWVRVTIDTPIS